MAQSSSGIIGWKGSDISAELRTQQLNPIRNQITALSKEMRTLQSIKMVAPSRWAALEKQLHDITNGLNEAASHTDAPVEARIQQQEAALEATLVQMRTLKGPAWDAARTQGRISTLAQKIDDLQSAANEIESRYNPDPESLSQKVFVAKAGPLKGKRFMVGDATESEIEANAPIKYSQNLYGVVGQAWLEAGQKDRTANLLESLKADPGFLQMAQEVPAGVPSTRWPEGWQPTGLRNFPAPSDQHSGWVFSPKMKAVLDQYAGALSGRGAGLDILPGLNKGILNLIFINPVAHYPNLGTNWLIGSGIQQVGRVARGIATLNPTETTAPFRNFVKAFNMVKNQNADMQDMILNMHSGTGAKQMNSKFYRDLSDRITNEVQNDPATKAALTKILGGPGQVLGWLRNVSNYATWMGDDILRTQAIVDLEDQGVPRAQAIREVGTALPESRIPAFLNIPIPGKAAENVGIVAGRILNNDVLFYFNRYHTGLINSLLHMTPLTGETPAQRLRNIERLGALFVTMQVLQPYADQLAKRITGDPRAYWRRAGLTAPINNAMLVAKGQETLPQGLSSLLTPSATLASLGGALMGGGVCLSVWAATEYTSRHRPGRGYSIARCPPDVVGAADSATISRAYAGINTPKLGRAESNLIFNDQQVLSKQVTAQVLQALVNHDPTSARKILAGFEQKLREDETATLQEQMTDGLIPKMTDEQLQERVNVYIGSQKDRRLNPYGMLLWPSVMKSIVTHATRSVLLSLGLCLCRS